MARHRLFVLFIASAIWLSACATPSTATIPPSPVPLQVVYSPYLAGIGDALQACALNLPQVAVFTEQVSAAQQGNHDQDVRIWWGDAPAGSESAFLLNYDELLVIVNPENPKQELSQIELIALFSGRIDRWSDIGILDRPVEVWFFPEDNLLSKAFQSGVLDGRRITRLASIAPSSQAMLESVADDPGAIGMLPKSWLTAGVQPVKIDQELQIALRKPLLALTRSDPEGGLAALLACLQTGEGQAILSEYYDPAQ